MAVTPSAGQPTRASSSSRARCPSWDSVVSAMAARPVEQALDQCVLEQVGLLLGEVPGFAPGADVVQLALHDRRVVPLPLGLVEHLFGDPERPAHRCQRPADQSGDQAHDRSSVTTRSRKAYGGCGPTYRSVIWPATCRSRSPTAASTRARSCPRTRSATLTTS